MIPESLTYYNFTESEKLVFDSLRTLGENFTVFYSVPWQKKTNLGNFRFNGECDFIIEHKDKGFISLEVKGGKDIKIENNIWYLYFSERERLDSDEYLENTNQFIRRLRQSPLAQSRDSMYFFVDHFKEKYGRDFSGLFGHAACFPNFRIKDDLGPEAPKQIIIDASGMINIEKRINEIFTYYEHDRKGRYIDKDHYDFINIIRLRRHYSITKGSLIRNRSDIFESINHTQDLYLEMIGEYKDALITGGAGTGKTFCAIKKTKQLASQGKRVLFICFNKNLAEHIKVNYFYNIHNVDCYNFHEFIKLSIGLDFYKKIFLESNNRFNGLLNQLQNSLERLPKFDAIIVDEGQDFEEEWFKCLSLFAKDVQNKIFYVFYDKNQDIFQGNISRILKLFNYPPFHLIENLRNCSEIQKWVVEKTGFGHDVMPNKIEGVEPIIFEVKSFEQVSSVLSSLFDSLIKNELIENHQLIILSDRKLENSILKENRRVGNYRIIDSIIVCDPNPANIRFATVQSFKGLESDVVIYLQHDNIEQGNNNMLKYVAYTRARFILYIFKCFIS